MNLKQFDYVVIDVETTGMMPQNGDRIVEIGAVKWNDGKIVDSFESLVNPQREIPEGAQRVNNISDEMVKDAPVSKEVMPKLIEFIAGACLVGHNIKFDLDFICYELALAGRKLSDRTPALDTLKMAKRFLPHLKSFKLTNLARSVGVYVAETHRALADVKITADVLNHLLNLAKDHKIDNFNQLFREFSIVKPSFKIKQDEQEALF